MSNSKDPTTITTLCLYKPNEKQTIKLQEEYDLDTYLKAYVSQNTSQQEILEIRPILQLPPPRIPPISISTPKSSDNKHHNSHKHPPTLYPIQEPDNTKDDPLNETRLDPSIDRMTSTYTIDNQIEISEPIPQPTITTITAHPDTFYHRYSQVPTIDYPDKVNTMTIGNTKPFISPSNRVSSTLPSNISLNLDVIQKTVRF